MNKLYPVHLTAEQHTHLEQLISTGTHQARVLGRARVLLLAAQNRPDTDIAAVLALSVPTVHRIRQRFVTAGLTAALYDKPRAGRPPLLTAEVEAKLVLLACSAPPKGRARWTLHLLADHLVTLHGVEHISHEQVRTMLKKTNLSPGATNSGASPKPTPAS